MENQKPYCFILMPFGIKDDDAGNDIDFNHIYDALLKPAVENAEMIPIRADEEQVGGIIHKPMFERLMLCEYAIADLTTANANVFYELGFRHAVKRCSTIPVFAIDRGQIPFDVNFLRAIPYTLDSNGQTSNLDNDSAMITQRLCFAREAQTDSPVYQLLNDYPNIQHTKTDVFRDTVAYSERAKYRLAQARLLKPAEKAKEELIRIEKDLEPIVDAESGVIIDLFLSYRAISCWENMLSLSEKMHPTLSSSIMVREQLGLALNRLGKRSEAEELLKSLITERGGSSETYGILGRVYKDMWDDAKKSNNKIVAEGYLEMAIDAYRKGFESDWRDAYPGINCITLMEISEPPHVDRIKLAPIVRYAAEQRIENGQPDYWDYATCLEASILDLNEKLAQEFLKKALVSNREVWELETTLRNLTMIRESRQARESQPEWCTEIELEIEANLKTYG